MAHIAPTFVLIAALILAGPAGVQAQEADIEAVLASLPVEDQVPEGYSRDSFEHWVDADDDGCDTRDEVLMSESLEPVEVEGTCRILLGRWYSALDGDFITNPSTMDVDHVVALAEAWRSGAHAWTDERREAFANDLDEGRTLRAVSSGVNRQKGARDPASWLPRLGVCGYVTDWVLVKAKWGLSVDPVEKQAITDVLATCKEETGGVQGEDVDPHLHGVGVNREGQCPLPACQSP